MYLLTNDPADYGQGLRHQWL